MSRYARRGCIVIQACTVCRSFELDGCKSTRMDKNPPIGNAWKQFLWAATRSSIRPNCDWDFYSAAAVIIRLTSLNSINHRSERFLQSTQRGNTSALPIARVFLTERQKKIRVKAPREGASHFCKWRLLKQDKATGISLCLMHLKYSFKDNFSLVWLSCSSFLNFLAMKCFWLRFTSGLNLSHAIYFFSAYVTDRMSLSWCCAVLLVQKRIDA